MPSKRTPSTTSRNTPIPAERLRTAGCPEPGCQMPAEVYAEADLGSTDGPVTIARTQCLARHVFLLPVEYIPGWPTVAYAREEAEETAG